MTPIYGIITLFKHPAIHLQVPSTPVSGNANNKSSFHPNRWQSSDNEMNLMVKYCVSWHQQPIRMESVTQVPIDKANNILSTEWAKDILHQRFYKTNICSWNDSTKFSFYSAKSSFLLSLPVFAQEESCGHFVSTWMLLLILGCFGGLGGAWMVTRSLTKVVSLILESQSSANQFDEEIKW